MEMIPVLPKQFKPDTAPPETIRIDATFRNIISYIK